MFESAAAWGVPTWLVVAIPLLTAYYIYGTWTFGVFKKIGVNGPRPLPVLGNMQPMMQGFFKSDTKYLQQYGKVVGTFLGRIPIMLIADLDILKEITVKEFHNFQNHMDLGFAQDPFDKMLTILKDDHWKHVRSVLSPTFSSGKLRKMTQQINRGCEDLVRNLGTKADANEDIEIKVCCGAFTMDVIASTAFGIHVDSHNDPKNAFVKNANKFFQFSFFQLSSIVLFFFPFLLKPLSKLHISIFPRDATDFFTDIVNQTMAGRKKNDRESDFIQLMINARLENSEGDGESMEQPSTGGDKYKEGGKDKVWNRTGLTHSEIVANGLIFFLAGFETTSSVLAMVCYLLAINQECQKKLLDEIEEVMKDQRELTYELILKMNYMDMCIKETMRLYPPAPRTDRMCTNDVTINGLFISKGVVVGIPIYHIHHDPEIWADPEKFDPERFGREESEGRHPCAWIPFGAGPRNCIGMRLAMFEMKMALVHMLKNFELVTCAKTQIPLKLQKFQLKGEKGQWIRMQRRNAAKVQ